MARINLMVYDNTPNQIHHFSFGEDLKLVTNPPSGGLAFYRLNTKNKKQALRLKGLLLKTIADEEEQSGHRDKNDTLEHLFRLPNHSQ